MLNKERVRKTKSASWMTFASTKVIVGLLHVTQKAPITKTRLFKYIESFTTKNWKCSDKKSDIFHVSAENIDCGYSFEPPCRGGSNEYPQSIFLSRNKKINVYPSKHQFYYMKVGKGVKIIQACFPDDNCNVISTPTQPRYVSVEMTLLCHCEYLAKIYEWGYKK